MANSLIGPRLLSDIRQTIQIVKGDSGTEGVIRIPTSFAGGGEKTFRICTFTGSWSINATKTVTFRGVTTTPNTVSAVNLFAAVSNTATKNCAIAKDGADWYLIAAEC